MVISIIIPVFNEEECLQTLLARLADEPIPHEIIVVDGGSSDESVAVAARSGVRVLKTTVGRGVQLRAGGEIARGDVILFLHPETVFFPPVALNGSKSPWQRHRTSSGAIFG